MNFAIFTKIYFGPEMNVYNRLGYKTLLNLLIFKRFSVFMNIRVHGKRICAYDISQSLNRKRVMSHYFQKYVFVRKLTLDHKK